MKLSWVFLRALSTTITRNYSNNMEGELNHPNAKCSTRIHRKGISNFAVCFERRVEKIFSPFFWTFLSFFCVNTYALRIVTFECARRSIRHSNRKAFSHQPSWAWALPSQNKTIGRSQYIVWIRSRALKITGSKKEGDEPAFIKLCVSQEYGPAFSRELGPGQQQSHCARHETRHKHRRTHSAEKR